MSEGKAGAVGKVVQIVGPAVDVEFEGDYLPPILQALRIKDDGELGARPIDLVVEVAQHLGENRLRCIAMSTTDAGSFAFCCAGTSGMRVVQLTEPQR